MRDPSIIDLQRQIIKNLEDMVAIQKEIIEDKNEIIRLQKTVIDLSDQITEEKIKLAITPSIN